MIERKTTVLDHFPNSAPSPGALLGKSTLIVPHGVLLSTRKSAPCRILPQGRTIQPNSVLHPDSKYLHSAVKGIVGDTRDPAHHNSRKSAVVQLKFTLVCRLRRIVQILLHLEAGAPCGRQLENAQR